MRKNKFGLELAEYLDFYNISIKDFAFRMNTTSKNIIDILNGKIELSQNMIYNISFITDISVGYIENVENNFKLDNKINTFLNKNSLDLKTYLKRFPFKELKEKYDFSFTDERNEYWILKDIMKYLRISDPEIIYKDNSTIFYKSKNDKPELLALWLERCYKIALKQQVKTYKKENLDKLISFINKEALKNRFNAAILIKEFNEQGIFLVIEEDLKGSKIRGAFKVLQDKPAIYITKKHKRIADLYFALLHELAHCKSDFNRAKKGSLVSATEEYKKEEYEEKADKQAFSWMVENKLYERIKENYKEIENKNIPKSFLAYRLAYDKLISYSSSFYQKNNKIVEENAFKL